MSGRKNKKRKIKNQAPKTKNRLGLIIVSLLIFFIVGLFAYNTINTSNKSNKRHNKTSQKFNNKSISSCEKSPLFPTKHGLKAPFAIDLRQGNMFKGLRIIEGKQNGKSMQLPSWDDFGFLGLYTLDDKGNIYTSPMPYVSIDINPPKDQNKILIVNSRTGIMTPFIELPSTNPPSAKNPFGVIGFEFDCTTKSLYATSLAGSSYKQESGKIFQINPSAKKILNTYDNLDVMGLVIHVGKKGRRLYLGLARKPEVFSVGLDETGNFMDDLRFEFSLKDVPGGSNVKAHRFIIKDNIMTIKAREFNFTLISSSVPMRSIYRYKYNNNTDKWVFIDLKSENPFAHLSNKLH